LSALAISPSIVKSADALPADQQSASETRYMYTAVVADSTIYYNSTRQGRVYAEERRIHDFSAVGAGSIK